MNETIRMVVTVKAYPVLSTKYHEAVCIAGVRTDSLFQARWVRLFPVQFRDLPQEKQFDKWDEIEVRATKHGGDTRPESYRPNIETIRVLGKLSPTQNWKARRAVIDLLGVTTMCEVIRRQREDGTSLAVIRPRRPVALKIELLRDADVVRRREAIAGQGSLFAQGRKPLEIPPYTFSYAYKCEEKSCRGHRQQIADWEVGQAYRKWRNSYPTQEELEAKLRQKWVDELCAPDRDTRFFVGNLHQHPKSFLVLGVFWPRY
jgi:hypothetical protein